MTQSFNKENFAKYRDQILLSFPNSLQNDVEAVLNILPFDESTKKFPSEDREIYSVDNLITTECLIVQQENEKVIIPSRIYLIEPDIEKENKLTERQKAILNCIYLRHCNGFIRQKRLEKILPKTDYWIIPFTIQLLGEYIYEILQVLDSHINHDTIISYRHFVSENSKHWRQAESRMISYWNEYYRQLHPKRKDYLGQILVDRINRQN